MPQRRICRRYSFPGSYALVDSSPVRWWIPPPGALADSSSVHWWTPPRCTRGPSSMHSFPGSCLGTRCALVPRLCLGTRCRTRGHRDRHSFPGSCLGTRCLRGSCLAMDLSTRSLSIAFAGIQAGFPCEDSSCRGEDGFHVMFFVLAL